MESNINNLEVPTLYEIKNNPILLLFSTNLRILGLRIVNAF